MPLIVQKFGGTSVADPEKIRAAARKAIRTQRQGNQVLMVVSAMGHNTDLLVDLAGQVNDKPPAREMDMLLSTGEQVSVALMAMAIDSLGSQAVSLTGGQLGIRTDNTFTKARIRSIEAQRIRRLLDAGNIVIAAGFQGIDDDLNITTLGRGGSDTTAVALAAVLGADACEIYTDVDGVYTTDPRLLPEARRVNVVSYDEMLELASLGAGVMHSRSIEFAKKFGVPIHVRSSFTDIEGTMIVAEPESQSAPVSGAALTRNEARVTILQVPDVPGTSLAIFNAISQRKIAVDMVVQNVGVQGLADISFTVSQHELKAVLDAVKQPAAELGATRIIHDNQVSKVSVVGLGMAHQTGVASRMFRALGSAGVNIQMITTSEIKISALVSRDQADTALRAVHSEFQLDRQPSDAHTWAEIRAEREKTADLQTLVSRLRDDALEELTLTGIAVSGPQARVTLHGVPDQPGIAAQVFETIGAAGIFVDMIVQGFEGEDVSANISFTLDEADLGSALQIAQQLCQSLAIQSVDGSAGVAKITVSGIGMRSHTQVGEVLFKTLADGGVNVQMINTSELQVNTVIAAEHAEGAHQHIVQAFASALQDSQ